MSSDSDSARPEDLRFRLGANSPRSIGQEELPGTSGARSKRGNLPVCAATVVADATSLELWGIDGKVPSFQGINAAEAAAIVLKVKGCGLAPVARACLRDNRASKSVRFCMPEVFTFDPKNGNT